MSALDGLLARAGSWRGSNTLQDPLTNQAEDSPATAVIMPLLGNRFVRIDYTWRYQGAPQEGSMLVGYQPEAGVVTLHWIDTWHMGDQVMACQGSADGSGQISVRGSYAAPPGPDWGWRITIATAEEQALGIVMFNVMPDGSEMLAVETKYAPV